MDHAAGGLLWDPGWRKTSATLAAITLLKREGLISKVLVIAPLRVCYSVWPAEVKKWADFEHLRVEVLHGLDKEEALHRDADIYCINPEGLEWLFGVTKEKVQVRRRDSTTGIKTVIHHDWKRIKSLGFDTLVVDEISKFKHSSSERFQVLKPVLPKFDRRWGLTGSPCSNGLLDLFGVMYVMDLGRSLGQFITHYRSAYFTPTGYGGYTWVLQHGAAEKIYERIAPVVHRLPADAHLQLPKLVINPIYVDLPPKARKIYDELEDDFITQLDSGIVTAANAGAALTKCRQVANGGLFLTQHVDDEGRKASKREWEDLHTAKIDAVEDLLEELGGSPAIVTYDFEHDLSRLLKLLGKDTPYIGGGVSPTKSGKILDAWNRREITALLGHPAAMAHGLNAQEGNACHIIWHSLTWDLDMYDQLIRRLRRSGNKAKVVTAHLIIARDTVDEAMLKAIKKKSLTQDALLEAVRAYSAERRISAGKPSKAIKKYSKK